MRNIYALCLLLLLFSACRKDRSKNPSDEGKKYPVSFSVDGFTVIPGEINLKTSSAKVSEVNAGTINSGADHIYYLIYKQDRTFVKMKHQTRGDSNFGVVTDTLSQGIYNCLFVASKDTVTINPSQVYIQFSTPGTDVFFKKVVLSVENQVNKNVTLNRIVSLLELRTEDPVPFSVKQIGLTVTRSSSVDFPSRRMDLISGVQLRESTYTPTKFDIRADEYGKPLIRKFYFFIPERNKYEVTFATYDLPGDMIRYKRVSDLTLEANLKNTLSGKLFDTPSNGAVVVLPDTNWSTPPIIHF